MIFSYLFAGLLYGFAIRNDTPLRLGWLADLPQKPAKHVASFDISSVSDEKKSTTDFRETIILNVNIVSTPIIHYH